MMNIAAMMSQQSPPTLHPLSLLAQLMSRQVSGCLQVTTASVRWVLYLENGKLSYASNTVQPFERLDRHLYRLSTQVPSLVSAVRVQVRLLFDVAAQPDQADANDYRAICWLVEQQYITVEQATVLIEGLAKEVLEPFLALREGTHDLSRQHALTGLPRLCQLELRPLVEHCQHQLHQKQAAGKPITPFKPSSPPPPLGGDAPKAIDRKPAIADFLQTPVDNPRNSHPTQDSVVSSIKSPDPLPKPAYTIACIDDSLTVLNAIKSFLDDRMFTVLMINSPVQALMQIVRSKPDLILLDVEMPNLDGYELCSLLRRHPSFKQTPIIMVTGHTGFVDRAKAKLVRASGYLTKPFTQSDLLKMVFKHLT